MTCGALFDGFAFSADDPERNADADRHESSDERDDSNCELRFVGACFADRYAKPWLVAVDRNLIRGSRCDGGSDEHAEDTSGCEQHASNHHPRVVSLILRRRRTCGRTVVRSVAVIRLITWGHRAVTWRGLSVVTWWRSVAWLRRISRRRRVSRLRCVSRRRHVTCWRRVAWWRRVTCWRRRVTCWWRCPGRWGLRRRRQGRRRRWHGSRYAWWRWRRRLRLGKPDRAKQQRG